MTISESERDAAIRRLHLAAADGRLTFAEADERIAAARSAVATDEIERLVRDLGAGAPVARAEVEPVFEPYPDPAAGVATGVAEPGYHPADPLVLSAGWQGAKRGGRWRVPPYIRASSGIDSVKIDCLLAEPMAQVIDLELVAGAGSVTLIVPEGWAVQVDRVSRGLGTAKSKVDPTPRPGCPIVVVRGGVGIGSFKARHANWFDRWKLKRRGIELPPPPKELR